MASPRGYLKQLCEKLPTGYPTCSLSFPDGERYLVGLGEPQFSIRFRTEEALTDTLTRFSLGFGEAYARGDVEIDGSITLVADLAYRLAGVGLNLSYRNRMLYAMYRAFQRHSKAADRMHVSYHYDLGHEFFRLFLDNTLTYSCAYYEGAGDKLEDAQRQKYEHVCRKLRLQAGERVVDCGCGWGGFAFYAAERYAVYVEGYTISRDQVEYCQAEARRRGLADRTRFVYGDYRDIVNKGTHQYDKFASIGMLEHVGKRNLLEYARVVARSLRRPSGLALIHTIGVANRGRMDAFAQKYIFPAAYIPTLSEVVRPFEQCRSDPLHVVDVENLRDHYALTLAAWFDRFQRQRSQIRERVGEAFTRTFELYLGNGPAAFKHKELDLFQVVFGWRESRELTRRSLYDHSEPNPFSVALQSDANGPAPARR